MVPQNQPKRGVRGYLAAFTLGLICMGVVVLLVRGRVGGNSVEGSRERGKTDRARSFAERGLTGDEVSKKRETARKSVTRPATGRGLGGIEEIAERVEGAEPSKLARPTMRQEAEKSAPIQTVRGAVELPILVKPGMWNGRVTLSGTPPLEKVVPAGQQCAELNPQLATRFYVVGRGQGLADVVVYISAGLPEVEWERPQQQVRMVFHACEMHPYVSAVRVGTEIAIENLDSMLHNVHFSAQAAGSREVNTAMLPLAEKPTLIALEAPELNARVKCDVHPWEFAYVSSFEHPFFAVSDRDGNFHLPLPPAGEYTVTAVHRKSGTIQQALRVEEGRGPEMRFNFFVPMEMQAQAETELPAR